jgi:hypothetical protein
MQGFSEKVPHEKEKSTGTFGTRLPRRISEPPPGERKRLNPGSKNRKMCTPFFPLFL